MRKILKKKLLKIGLMTGFGLIGAAAIGCTVSYALV
jgi:hypothetical protein